MFKVNAILAAVPVTYRQIDHWCHKGWIHAARDAEGTGIDRMFFGADLEQARNVARLVNAGVAPRLAATLAGRTSVALGDRYRLVMVRTSR